MSSRLQKMDSILKKIVENIPDDCLLLMFGDHGMTDDGNHGGSTIEETDSGLFVYSKKKLFPSFKENNDKCNVNNIDNDKIINQSINNSKTTMTMSWSTDKESLEPRNIIDIMKNPRIISQIDLIPTISILLGIPIPFSSIGMVIPELLQDNAYHYNNSSSKLLLESLQVNSIQVMKYLNIYFSPTYDYNNSDIKDINNFTKNYDLQNIQNLFNVAIESHKNLIGKDMSNITSKVVIAEYVRFLIQSQELGRRMWTSFNIPYMVISIIILLICFISSIIILFSNIYENNNDDIKNLINLESSVKNVKLFLRQFRNLLINNQQDIPLYTKGVILMAIFHSISVFSNSFIIHEQFVLYFIIQTTCNLLVLELVSIILSSLLTNQTRSYSNNNDMEKYNYSNLRYGFFIRLFYCFIAMFCARLSWNIYQNIIDTKHERDQSLKINSSMKLIFISRVQALFLIFILSFVTFKYFQYNGKKQHQSSSILNKISKKIMILSSLLFSISQLSICVFFNIQLDIKNSFIKMDNIILIISNFINLFWKIHDNINFPQIALLCSTVGVLTIIMSYIMIRIENQKIESNNYENLFYLFHVCFHFINMLYLVSSILSNSIVLLMLLYTVIISIILIEIVQEIKKKVNLKLGINKINWLIVGFSIHISMVGRLVYFLTDHRYEFSSLKLEAGFIGVDKFYFIYAGIMLMMNTVGFEIIIIITISIAVGIISIYSNNATKLNKSQINNNIVNYYFISLISIVMYRIIVIFCSLSSSFFLRRHLMVWAIFAPKTFFESNFWLVDSVCCIIGLAMLIY